MVKDNSNLFIVAIVACLAIVSLFWMVQYSQQTTNASEEVVVVDEEGNIVGMADFPGLLIGPKPPSRGFTFVIKSDQVSNIIKKMKAGNFLASDNEVLTPPITPPSIPNEQESGSGEREGIGPNLPQAPNTFQTLDEGSEENEAWDEYCKEHARENNPLCN